MKKALLITLPIIAIAIVVIALYYNNKQEYYYDFDEVIYYKTTKDFNDLVAIGNEEVRSLKDVKTLRDSVAFQIMGDFEEAVPYDVAATYVDSIGFEKKILPVSKHTALMEIFREKPKMRTEWTTCEPIYRDIYVFKKNGKVVGMGKLCYECGDSRFFGTNAATGDFGMDGEYGKLKELVK
jgi:hypothetical protein